jgi:hypothetical protein
LLRANHSEVVKGRLFLDLAARKSYVWPCGGMLSWLKSATSSLPFSIGEEVTNFEVNPA